MRARVPLGAYAVVLAVLGAATFSAAKSALASQQILYSTGFANMSGWQVSGASGGKWQAYLHTLVHTPWGAGAGLGDPSQVIAPQTTRGMTHFAVQAKIQYNGGKGGSSSSCFGIVVRTRAGGQPTEGHSGMLAGSCEIDSDHFVAIGSASYNGCYMGCPAIRPIGSHTSLDVGRSWHLYRLEVRGFSYRLLLDGQVVASGRSTSYLSATRVGFFAQQAAISARAFKIFRLA